MIVIDQQNRNFVEIKPNKKFWWFLSRAAERTNIKFKFVNPQKMQKSEEKKVKILETFRNKSNTSNPHNKIYECLNLTNTSLSELTTIWMMLSQYQLFIMWNKWNCVEFELKKNKKFWKKYWNKRKCVGCRWNNGNEF